MRRARTRACLLYTSYTTPTDSVAHYSLISSLNPTDQALVQLLPSGLVFQYPVDYTLTDSQGRPHAVRFLGHSTSIVKYSVVADGSIQVQPIASLSAQDQAFVRLLPAYIALDYPVDRTLTDVQGKTFDAHILGRSTGVVKLTLASDGTTQYYPVSTLSDAEDVYKRQGLGGGWERWMPKRYDANQANFQTKASRGRV